MSTLKTHNLQSPDAGSVNIALAPNAGMVVTGISTFTGAIDANGDLDVDGHTELDNINISGVSTHVGLSQFQNTINLTHASAGQNYIYFNEDLQFAKNGTGIRLKIDSSGRVGINQTNPARALTVNALGTGTSSRIVRLATQDNNTRFDFSFENTDFLTIQNGVNDSAIVKLHKSGYVTKPAHPSFHARLINHKNADQNPLYFDDVLVNVGSHYKTSGSDQGKFVVPVAGIYFFFWEAIKNNLNGSVTRLYLMKNGSKTYTNMHLRLQENGRYSNGCMNVVMTLAVGDKIHINLDDGGVHASEYTHFGGYLIG